MSWLEDLKDSSGGGEGGEPPDGNHTAQLVHAVILDTKNGTRIKLEWQSEDMAFYWDSWHGVEGAPARFTRGLLTKLGLDLTTVASEEQLADELAALENTTYVVNVKRNGTFLNTSVVDRGPVQTELPVQAPVTPAPRSAIFDDDDVPF